MSFGYHCLILTGIWTGIAAGVRAQPEDPVFPLEGVEIVSDRLGRAEARTGRHTTVIRGEDIMKFPAQSLDELLGYLPFLETQARGGFGVQSDILLRGGTFNQVLVLVDGMRINDPLTGHFNSYIPVSLSEISRIEVYRGAASSLYGPDAVGGVIHIITKNFIPGETREHLEGRLEAWYGKHNLVRSNSGINLAKGRFQAGAGLTFNSSDGHPLEHDTLKGDFRLGTASVSASYRISERFKAGFRTAYDNRLFNARYFYTRSPLDQSREHVKKWWSHVFTRFQPNPSHTLILQAAYQSTVDSFLFNPLFPANIHQTNYHNFQAGHLYMSPSGHRLATGLQADRREISSTDRGNHAHWHTGAYIVYSMEIFVNGTLSSGARLDYDPLYKLQFLPQVNISRSFEKINFRTSLGRSIRSPDFTEMYISTGLEGPLSSGRNLGNPRLRAERSWSFEAGFDRMLSPGVQFRFTGFWRFSRDLIDYIVTVSDEIANNTNLIAGESYFWAKNIGLLNTLGTEALFKGDHQLAGGVELNWGISWQHLNSGHDGPVSKYLSAHARNLLNANLGFTGRSLRLNMTSLYKERDRQIEEIINASLTPSYMLFNMKGDVILFNKHVILSLQVNNLFNTSYSDILGAKMPGRWMSGGITWSFTGK